MRNTFLFFCLLFICPVINHAQNVGIGTTTPTNKLHVMDASNDVRVMVESPAAGSYGEIRLLAGANPFSFLQFTKFAPGSTGTYAGLPKDNLSVIGTGGNGGSMILSTGDGVSPVVIAAGAGEQMRITADNRVGIGTNTPANKLHVHDALANQDASIVLTNSLTGTNPLRGARFRFLNSDLIVHNYEATGKIHFATAFNTRMTIDDAGNVGIGTMSPLHKLDIAASGAIDGIRVSHAGNNATGITSFANGTVNLRGILGNVYENMTGSDYGIGVHGVSGSGGVFLTPVTNYGVLGESQNPAKGIGVMGTSNSPSVSMAEAAVLGLNFSNTGDTYGVIGKAGGSGGAGVAGVAFSASTTGTLGFASVNNSTALKAEVKPGFTGTALEIKNGPIKVSGANPTVFQHIATAGNIFFNGTEIPNTTLANSATDLLIVTPYWDGVYVNSPIGVYFDAGTWRIFRQDSGAMPVGAKFNILVVKQ